jgi:hypothetical protein
MLMIGKEPAASQRQRYLPQSIRKMPVADNHEEDDQQPQILPKYRRIVLSFEAEPLARLRANRDFSRGKFCRSPGW